MDSGTSRDGVGAQIRELAARRYGREHAARQLRQRHPDEWDRFVEEGRQRYLKEVRP